MKYVISFSSGHFYKPDLDKMTDEERWDAAEYSMGIGCEDACIVTLDEWVQKYNSRNINDGYIFIVDHEDESISDCSKSCGKNESAEIDREKAWRFYDEVAEPQVGKYIEEYDGDMSVFWHGEDKTFWYECWIDLTDNWISGEKLYLQCKDMDLTKLGEFLFEKLCKYEAYYDSPQWIEDLNKMAECLK